MLLSTLSGALTERPCSLTRLQHCDFQTLTRDFGRFSLNLSNTISTSLSFPLKTCCRDCTETTVRGVLLSHTFSALTLSMCGTSVFVTNSSMYWHWQVVLIWLWPTVHEKVEDRKKSYYMSFNLTHTQPSYITVCWVEHILMGGELGMVDGLNKDRTLTQKMGVHAQCETTSQQWVLLIY